MRNIWILFLFLISPQLFSIEEAVVYSPDKRICLRVHKTDSIAGKIYYSIDFKKKNIVDSASFSLDFKDSPSIFDSLEFIYWNSFEENESWERVWGKRKTVKDNFTEITARYKEKTRLRRNINLVFRLYNDGIAMQYYLPYQESLLKINIVNENTVWNFNANHEIWATKWHTFEQAQESPFLQYKISDIKNNDLLGTPLLINFGENRWGAMMEASLSNWAAMCIKRDTSKAYNFYSKLSPLYSDSSLAVITNAPRYSPWRVLMLAENPGKFIESDILQNLCSSSMIVDPTWIKPGKAAWDWWWSGKYAPEVNFKVGSNTETMKHYIDLAAEMNWQYQIVDCMWYGNPFDTTSKVQKAPNPNSDITKSNPEIDIPELVRYAKSKDVGIILWMHWKHAEKQMEEAFSLYEKWGVAGVKIDYMNRNDQAMVNFYHKVADRAAKHRLLVDFHGAMMPTGYSRVYPNMITREGVLGNEFNKWSKFVTPEHCVTLPYTRMLGGEMDFTPGGFLNSTKDSFKVVGFDAPAPQVMGTRCFQLAMMVIYESALQVMCDAPFNYRNQPGTDFLKMVPTTWDDTRFVDGEIGQYIVVARRSGSDWYLAGMTNWTERTIDIKLNFLEYNRLYEAEIWKDAPDCNIDARKLVKESRNADKITVLNMKMASGGGFVIKLKQVE